MLIARVLLPLLPGLLLLACCQQPIKIQKGRPYPVSGHMAHCEGYCSSPDFYILGYGPLHVYHG